MLVISHVHFLLDERGSSSRWVCSFMIFMMTNSTNLWVRRVRRVSELQIESNGSSKLTNIGSSGSWASIIIYPDKPRAESIRARTDPRPPYQAHGGQNHRGIENDHYSLFCSLWWIRYIRLRLNGKGLREMGALQNAAVFIRECHGNIKAKILFFKMM